MEKMSCRSTLKLGSLQVEDGNFPGWATAGTFEGLKMLASMMLEMRERCSSNGLSQMILQAMLATAFMGEILLRPFNIRYFWFGAPLRLQTRWGPNTARDQCLCFEMHHL